MTFVRGLTACATETSCFCSEVDGLPNLQTTSDKVIHSMAGYLETAISSLKDVFAIYIKNYLNQLHGKT